MAEHSMAKGKQSNRASARNRAKWWLSDENGKYFVSTQNGLLKSPKDGKRFQHVIAMSLPRNEGEAGCLSVKVLKMTS